ncbi:AbrB/MazE/SpoVT family DNA-binding domain-containing protein [Sporosarcina sp. PTS2304]|uniref:AbrB/MazE/SpoVT family DNA-binding domain-containing protein n=1 Tax=Sporosarcina sp. PTS2304 TaxID=2283194 RepID=UPI000E0D9C39|nr:AbrB/MazE/SpoVT family DNA-binding domain-containing protein [Sporosarcina sp. PTS2304]AXH99586.1 AbrB/MazE/SpoVT family DNA-binding domain-containing protein [Sporosarcina sp. PTS2304]
MKSLGIVRKVDHLGRIVIPKELRKSLLIDKGDPIEIFAEDDRIILRKYQVNRACFITGEVLNENKELSNGLFISPEGAKILLKELDDLA